MRGFGAVATAASEAGTCGEMCNISWFVVLFGFEMAFWGLGFLCLKATPPILVLGEGYCWGWLIRAATAYKAPKIVIKTFSTPGA